MDYVYFARLLEADKQYDEAVAQFDKALSMDKSHTEIYKDISDAVSYTHLDVYKRQVLR